MTGQKKKIKQYVDRNPVESFRDIGTGITRSLKNDVFSASVNTLWEQLLGGQQTEKQPQRLSGDLTPGTEIDLKKIRTTREIVAPGFDYRREVRTAEVRVAQEDQTYLKQRITEIQHELKKLAKTSRELEIAFKEVTVETVPAKPGKYHLNFFEWLLNVIRQARLKVDESRSWLTVLFQRRAKKQYWAMFKKHGTTFGLSSERVVATQTG